MEAPQKLKIRGYLYILIQTFTLPLDKEVTGHISLGQTAKCVTKPHLSGKTVNQVFLIEVAEESTRLSIEFKQGEKSVGECRYDIIPFFAHPGSTHTMSSDLNNIDQVKQGTVAFKITYYSGQFGKLRVRVFGLEMSAAVVDHFKVGRLKAKVGVYAQSSQEWDMSKPFDETLELLVLSKTNNLQFQVVHTEGVLAKFTIYDLQKSGLLIAQTKAYQVSLFNGDKAVGNIKYQIDWIH